MHTGIPNPHACKTARSLRRRRRCRRTYCTQHNVGPLDSRSESEKLLSLAVCGYFFLLSSLLQCVTYQSAATCVYVDIIEVTKKNSSLLHICAYFMSKYLYTYSSIREMSKLATDEGGPRPKQLMLTGPTDKPGPWEITDCHNGSMLCVFFFHLARQVAAATTFKGEHLDCTLIRSIALGEP